MDILDEVFKEAFESDKMFKQCIEAVKRTPEIIITLVMLGLGDNIYKLKMALLILCKSAPETMIEIARRFEKQRGW